MTSPVTNFPWILTNTQILDPFFNPRNGGKYLFMMIFKLIFYCWPSWIFEKMVLVGKVDVEEEDIFILINISCYLDQLTENLSTSACFYKTARRLSFISCKEWLHWYLYEFLDDTSKKWNYTTHVFVQLPHWDCWTSKLTSPCIYFLLVKNYLASHWFWCYLHTFCTFLYWALPVF